MEWWKVLTVIIVSILMGAAAWELCKIAEAAGYSKGQADAHKEQRKEFMERNKIDIRG